MKTLSTTVAAIGVATLLLSACGTDPDPVVDPTTTDAPSDADTGAPTGTESEPMAPAVMFANVADGDTITSPFEITFEAVGVDVVPAGDVAEGEGHFHLMIDVPCVAAGEVIANDDAHLHFGDGSVSTTIELAAGEHTLCLQFADGVHTATDLTAEITVTVA